MYESFFFIKFKHLIFLQICISGLLACQVKGKEELQGSSVISNKNYSIGKIIKLPDTIDVYAPFKNYLLDSTHIAKQHSFKIYSYVNVSCPPCIEGIEKWEELVPIFFKNGVPVILICYSKDNFEFIKHLCEAGQIKDFSFPFYLDTKDQFRKKNPYFPQYEPDETFLTDSNNTILLTGNPINSKKILELYIEAIQKK